MRTKHNAGQLNKDRNMKLTENYFRKKKDKNTKH